MKTHFEKKDNSLRKWHLIDATDKVVGRLSTEIANILRGKNKPQYTPFVDMGDFVVVINCKNIKLTGAKLEQKKYYKHSGWLGNLKQKTAGEFMETKPHLILEYSVKGMLPKNRLQAKYLKKLKLYDGPDHPHAAQLAGEGIEEETKN